MGPTSPTAITRTYTRSRSDRWHITANQPRRASTTPGVGRWRDKPTGVRHQGAQVPGHLRDRLAGLPDQPHSALPEIRIELPARLCHRPVLPLRRCLHATRGSPNRSTGCGSQVGSRPFWHSPSRCALVLHTSILMLTRQDLGFSIRSSRS